MPAMSRLCALGAAVLAQAGARSDDWDRYMKQYAGDYYQGSMDGEFSGFVDRYAKSYAKDANSYSEYSKDRLNQAKQYQGKYEGKFAGDYEGKYADKFQGKSQGKYASDYQGKSAPAGAAAPQVLAAVPAVVSGKASELAVQRSASERAQAGIQQLREWDAKLEKDLNNTDFSLTVAKGIVTKVQTTFLSQHNDALHRFQAAIHDLDPTTLGKADSSEVHQAERKAKEALHAMAQVDHEELQAMRSTLRSIQKAGDKKAKALWKGARQAAHEVLKSGMRGAREQRRAGARESVYEQSMLDAEMQSERLAGEAEEAGEKAERLVEKQRDRVEIHLEAMMEDFHNQEVAQHEQNAERLRAAKEAVRQARAAAESMTTASAQEAQPAAFLAAHASSADLHSSLIAPLACITMVGAMASLIAVRFCRGAVAMEHPLLG